MAKLTMAHSISKGGASKRATDSVSHGNGSIDSELTIHSYTEYLQLQLTELVE